MTVTLARKKQDAPTAPGAFYARYVAGPNPDRVIRSVRVIIQSVHPGTEKTGTDVLAVLGSFRTFPLRYFEWFGPVPECVEEQT